MRAWIAVLMLLVAPSIQLRSQQKVPTRFNQGVAHWGGGWILSGTDDLARVDTKLKAIAENTSPIPSEWAAKGYNHMGDIDLTNGIIYAPFEQPDYNLGHQATARYDVATFARNVGRGISGSEIALHLSHMKAMEAFLGGTARRLLVKEG